MTWSNLAAHSLVSVLETKRRNVSPVAILVGVGRRGWPWQRFAHLGWNAGLREKRARFREQFDDLAVLKKEFHMFRSHARKTPGEHPRRALVIGKRCVASVHAPGSFSFR